MIRTLIVAAFMSVLGTTASQSQYSSPNVDDEPGYENGYDDEYQYDHEDGYNGPDNVEVGMFAELGSYGRWYQVGAYGWVWRPFVVASWRPFANGHWVWTDDGWTWISYEPFGWATYHYGYWTYEYPLGWVWIPSYDWSPCRVEWVVYDDYVCWAPLPPPGVHLVRPWARSGFNFWISVHAGHFTDVRVVNYRVRPRFKSSYAQHAAVFHSPERRFIERYKGESIRTVSVDFDRKKVGGHEFKRVKLPSEQTRIVEKHQVRVNETREWRAPKRSGRLEKQRYHAETRGSQKLYGSKGSTVSKGDSRPHGSSQRESGKKKKSGKQATREKGKQSQKGSKH